MNYTELTANIQDLCETTFSADQLALFVQQAETAIYNAVQIPALRKNVTGALTSGNEYLSAPADFLYVYSIMVQGSGGNVFLLDKDVNFIREAYPSPASTGVPKHYALFDKDSFIVGPTPDANYSVELHYGYYPESIVTAGNTWLGDNFSPALLNGAMVEAVRFQKQEPDIIQLYQAKYVESLALLKNLGDGKLRQDTYRAGQVKAQVK